MTTPLPPVDEDRLVALVHDPATSRQGWAARSLCHGLPIDTYFPEDDVAPPPTALIRCRACPVSHECLATALIHEAVDGHRSGWWGGFGPEDRASLWAGLGAPAVAAPVEIGAVGAVAKARQLRAQGLTVAAIAAQLGCSERTIHRYLAASAA